MSTANFHNENARNIFAVEIENEFDLEDAIDNVRYGLKNIFKDSYMDCNSYDTDALRCHGGQIIAEIDGEIKTYKKLNIDVYPVLQIVVRSGYYGGANFDYKMLYNIEDEVVEDIDRVYDALVDNAEHYEHMSIDEANRNAKFAEKFLESAMSKLRDKVEKVLAENSTPLNCIGTASNGEAFYEKAM